MMLGRYLARGLGGEANVEQARHWLRLALAAGQNDAAGDLAALPARELVEDAPLVGLG